MFAFKSKNQCKITYIHRKTGKKILVGLIIERCNTTQLLSCVPALKQKNKQQKFDLKVRKNSNCCLVFCFELEYCTSQECLHSNDKICNSFHAEGIDQFFFLVMK